MSNFLTVGHSFNFGDCITVLPGLQKIHKETGKPFTFYQRVDLPVFYYEGAEHPVKSDSGDQVCMNTKTLDLLYPLLMNQPYIKNMMPWTDEKVDFDIDRTRMHSFINTAAASIHHYPSLIYPQLQADLSLKWIHTVKRKAYKDRIVVNRTFRYNNPFIKYYFLKKYESQLLFVGLPEEHQAFCKQWELDIPYESVDNFYQLASIINSCKFFIGNQSACWHLADAQKVPRILEICAQFPNTWPTGKDGYCFIEQVALEHFVERLNKS